MILFVESHEIAVRHCVYISTCVTEKEEEFELGFATCLVGAVAALCLWVQFQHYLSGLGEACAEFFQSRLIGPWRLPIFASGRISFGVLP